MNNKRKIILAGGSGFLGRALGKHLSQAGYEVVVLTRRLGACAATGRVAYWDGVTKGAWCAELEGAHAVINLAGRSVDCRYTLKNRRLILESRLRVSWLHVEDFCGIVEAVIEGRLTGSLYNCAAPQPLKNVAFMQANREAVGGLAPYVGLPTPKLLLKIGAFLIRTETELVLKSRKVAPENLIREGYQFKYPQLAGAVQAIVARAEEKALPDRRLAEV